MRRAIGPNGSRRLPAVIMLTCGREEQASMPNTGLLMDLWGPVVNLPQTARLFVDRGNLLLNRLSEGC
jgi:hypothetical protein